MHESQFHILEGEAAQVSEYIERECWKRDHDRAIAVWELEHIFRRLEVMVEDAVRLDLQLHANAESEGDAAELDAWYAVLNRVLTIGKRVLREIENKAMTIQAAAYRDAVITTEKVRALRKQIDEGLGAIEEWEGWKPPESRAPA